MVSLRVTKKKGRKRETDQYTGCVATGAADELSRAEAKNLETNQLQEIVVHEKQQLMAFAAELQEQGAALDSRSASANRLSDELALKQFFVVALTSIAFASVCHVFMSMLEPWPWMQQLSVGPAAISSRLPQEFAKRQGGERRVEQGREEIGGYTCWLNNVGTRIVAKAREERRVNKEREEELEKKLEQLRLDVELHAAEVQQKQAAMAADLQGQRALFDTEAETARAVFEAEVEGKMASLKAAVQRSVDEAARVEGLQSRLLEELSMGQREEKRRAEEADKRREEVEARRQEVEARDREERAAWKQEKAKAKEGLDRKAEELERAKERFVDSNLKAQHVALCAEQASEELERAKERLDTERAELQASLDSQLKELQDALRAEEGVLREERGALAEARYRAEQQLAEAKSAADQSEAAFQAVQDRTSALLMRQDELAKFEVQLNAREIEIAREKAQMEHEWEELRQAQDADWDRARLQGQFEGQFETLQIQSAEDLSKHKGEMEAMEAAVEQAREEAAQWHKKVLEKEAELAKERVADQAKVREAHGDVEKRLAEIDAREAEVASRHKGLLQDIKELETKASALAKQKQKAIEKARNMQARLASELGSWEARALSALDDRRSAVETLLQKASMHLEQQSAELAKSGGEAGMSSTNAKLVSETDHMHQQVRRAEDRAAASSAVASEKVERMQTEIQAAYEDARRAHTEAAQKVEQFRKETAEKLREISEGLTRQKEEEVALIREEMRKEQKRAEVALVENETLLARVAGLDARQEAVRLERQALEEDRSRLEDDKRKLQSTEMEIERALEDERAHHQLEVQLIDSERIDLQRRKEELNLKNSDNRIEMGKKVKELSRDCAGCTPQVRHLRTSAPATQTNIAKSP
eukprot:gene16137-22291_t